MDSYRCPNHSNRDSAVRSAGPSSPRHILRASDPTQNLHEIPPDVSKFIGVLGGSNLVLFIGPEHIIGLGCHYSSQNCKNIGGSGKFCLTLWSWVTVRLPAVLSSAPPVAQESPSKLQLTRLLSKVHEHKTRPRLALSDPPKASCREAPRSKADRISPQDVMACQNSYHWSQTVV